MPASPSPLNYFIGKGTVSYTPAGGTLRSLGNCPSFKVTPTLEYLEHFSSMGGVKEQDDEVLLSKAGTVELTLDEITLDNVAIALLATDAVDPAVEIEMLSASAKTGLLVLTGTNDKGNKFTVTVNKVNWRPEEGVDFISEAYGVLTLSGKMLKVAGSFGTVEKIADGTL